MPTYRVRDFMKPAVRLATAEMTVEETARCMVTWRVSGLPVVDEAHHVIGVVSFTDLAACAGGVQAPTLPQSSFYHSVWVPEHWESKSGLPAAKARVREVMTRRVVAVRPHTDLAEAASLLLREQIHRLLVLNGEGVAVGILTTVDMTRALHTVLTAEV